MVKLLGDSSDYEIMVEFLNIGMSLQSFYLLIEPAGLH